MFFGHHRAPERRPTAAKRSGVEGVRAYFEALREEWTIERHDPQEFIGWGDRVAVRTSVRARHNRTGKTFEMEKVDLLTVRDGRVCSFQEI